MIKKLLACTCIIIALIFTYINTCFEATEAALSTSVIRLHVIAHSNSDEDQKLKLMVRDRVLNEAPDIFDVNTSVTDAEKQLLNNLDRIKSIAQKEISANGFNYDVKVSLGNSSFPTKEYGELVLPAGSYKALKIEIGEAKGRNWWCVLFPPLCFVDESCVSANTEAIHSIEKSVGKENAPLIASEKNQSARIRFKTYEIWQKSKQKLVMLLN